MGWTTGITDIDTNTRQPEAATGQTKHQGRRQQKRKQGFHQQLPFMRCPGGQKEPPLE